MEYTIKTKFHTGQRVWMPGNNGLLIKGRVKRINLVYADLSEHPDKVACGNVNYHCIDEHGTVTVYHEYQLKERN